jgi:hypothetical protein
LPFDRAAGEKFDPIPIPGRVPLVLQRTNHRLFKPVQAQQFPLKMGRNIDRIAALPAPAPNYEWIARARGIVSEAWKYGLD